MKIGNTDVDIDTNQIKTDLTATHADGTKLSIFEKVILLIKHNPLIIIAIIYSIFPLDLIPDALPVIGSVDDTIVLFMPMLKLFQETLDARAQIPPTDTPVESGTLQISTAAGQAADALNKFKNIANQAKNIYTQINPSAGNTVETNPTPPEQSLPDLAETIEDISDDSMPKLKSKFDDLL